MKKGCEKRRNKAKTDTYSIKKNEKFGPDTKGRSMRPSYMKGLLLAKYL